MDRRGMMTVHKCQTPSKGIFATGLSWSLAIMRSIAEFEIKFEQFQIGVAR